MLEFLIVLIVISILVFKLLSNESNTTRPSGYKNYYSNVVSKTTDKIDVDEQIDNETWRKARQILNSADIAHASQNELYKIIDKLATLDDDNLSTDVKQFPIEQIRSALLDYKAQLNEKNLDSKGSTSSRQILNSNLTDSQIDNAEFEINNEGSCQSSNKIKQTNNKTPKSNINKAMMSELGIAEDLGFDELEDLKNEEIRKEKLANYEYYTDYDEDDL